MRKLLKNKNFLPNSFIRNKEESKSKGEKRGIFLLVLLNLIMLPIVIGKFQGPTNEVEKDKKEEIVKEVSLKSDVVNWLDIEKYNIDGDINETEGTFKVNNIKIIQEIEKDEKFYINSIENLGENKYKVIIKKGAYYER